MSSYHLRKTRYDNEALRRGFRKCGYRLRSKPTKGDDDDDENDDTSSTLWTPPSSLSLSSTPLIPCSHVSMDIMVWPIGVAIAEIQTQCLIPARTPGAWVYPLHTGISVTDIRAQFTPELLPCSVEGDMRCFQPLTPELVLTAESEYEIQFQSGYYPVAGTITVFLTVVFPLSSPATGSVWIPTGSLKIPTLFKYRLRAACPCHWATSVDYFSSSSDKNNTTTTTENYCCSKHEALYTTSCYVKLRTDEKALHDLKKFGRWHTWKIQEDRNLQLHFKSVSFITPNLTIGFPLSNHGGCVTQAFGAFGVLISTCELIPGPPLLPSPYHPPPPPRLLPTLIGGWQFTGGSTQSVTIYVYTCSIQMLNTYAPKSLALFLPLLPPGPTPSTTPSATSTTTTTTTTGLSPSHRARLLHCLSVVALKLSHSESRQHIVEEILSRHYSPNMNCTSSVIQSQINALTRTVASDRRILVCLGSVTAPRRIRYCPPELPWALEEEEEEDEEDKKTGGNTTPTSTSSSSSSTTSDETVSA